MTQFFLTNSAGRFRIGASSSVLSRIARMCQITFVKKREMAVLLNRREIYYSRHEAQTSSLPGRFDYIRIYTCICVSSPLRISRSLDQLKPFLCDVRVSALSRRIPISSTTLWRHAPKSSLVSLYRIVKQWGLSILIYSFKIKGNILSYYPDGERVRLRTEWLCDFHSRVPFENIACNVNEYVDGLPLEAVSVQINKATPIK